MYFFEIKKFSLSFNDLENVKLTVLIDVSISSCIYVCM